MSLSSTTPTSEISSASEHQLITYYNDVIDEVDSHFSRALSSTSSNEPQSTPRNDTADDETISPFSSGKQSRSSSAPPKTLSSSCSLEISGGSCSNTPDNLPAAPTASNTTEVVATELAEIKYSTSTMKMKLPKSDKDAIATKTVAATTTTTIITHPDLAKLLVYPIVDSYLDAPRVPGQPTLSTKTPFDLHYIKGIAITAYDYQLVASCRLKQHGGLHPHYSTVYPQHYSSPHSTCQYSHHPSHHNHSINNSYASNTPQQRSHSDYIADHPTGGQSTSTSYNHGYQSGRSYQASSRSVYKNLLTADKPLFHQPLTTTAHDFNSNHSSVSLGHTVPLTHNTGTSQPVELSVDDVQQILAL